jgi:hypothetical protein
MDTQKQGFVFRSRWETQTVTLFLVWFHIFELFLCFCDCPSFSALGFQHGDNKMLFFFAAHMVLELVMMFGTKPSSQVKKLFNCSP